VFLLKLMKNWEQHLPDSWDMELVVNSRWEHIHDKFSTPRDSVDNQYVRCSDNPMSCKIGNSTDFGNPWMVVNNRSEHIHDIFRTAGFGRWVQNWRSVCSLNG
jgi:hypothetical protein